MILSYRNNSFYKNPTNTSLWILLAHWNVSISFFSPEWSPCIFYDQIFLLIFLVKTISNSQYVVVSILWTIFMVNNATVIVFKNCVISVYWNWNWANIQCSFQLLRIFLINVSELSSFSFNYLFLTGKNIKYSFWLVKSYWLI